MFGLPFKKSTGKGFTIVEMMIVVALIGVITILVFPSLKSLKRDHVLYSEAKVLASYIRYTQQLAFDRSAASSLVFEVSGRSYTVTAGGTAVKTVNLENGVTLEQTIPAGDVNFGTDGKPTGILAGGFKKIILISGSNRMYIYLKEGGDVDVTWENIA